LISVKENNVIDQSLILICWEEVYDQEQSR
jgi:hypothetical protein